MEDRQGRSFPDQRLKHNQSELEQESNEPVSKHTYISGEENLVKGSGEVIDSLHIATCGMPNRPHV